MVGGAGSQSKVVPQPFTRRVAAGPPSSAPRPQSLRRIPSLDGLRAVAIGLVLAGHLSGVGQSWFPFRTGKLGDLGVRVFFVLSGYLITSLLLGELSRTGTISLPMFYFRRTLRIFPAYYVFVLVVVVAAGLGALVLLPGDVTSAVTYTSNFHIERSWWLGHTWSLAVEEQFYLLWPMTVLWAGRRRAALVAAAVLVVAPASRVLITGFVPSWRLGVGEFFPTIADALATGCLLAFFGDRLWQDERFRRVLRSPLALGALLVAIVTLNRLQPVLRFSLPLGESLLNLAIALVIGRCMWLPGRLLNSRPLVWLGQLSYSVYLWQQLFLRHGEEALGFPWNLAAVTVAAGASYYLVESPCLRLRDRLEWRLRAR